MEKIGLLMTDLFFSLKAARDKGKDNPKSRQECLAA
jgi:hypothetical protein